MCDYQKILEQLKNLPQTWHASGPLDDNVLQALADQCQKYGTVRRSVETGAGKSTLFFSQVSRRHTVFAIDIGKSLTRVKESDILSPDVVEFVEGPTQLTVPVYKFDEQVDLALIDGPHGYPFPDLEYYYFYPRIKKGGILIIDDINIPTIRKMVDIIQCDDMFDTIDVIGKTMFFRRTEAPLFDPLADGWWEQAYNKRFLRRTKRLEKIKKSMPASLFNLIPKSLRLAIQKYL